MLDDSTPSDMHAADRAKLAPGDEAVLRLVDGVLAADPASSALAAGPVNVEAALASVRARIASGEADMLPAGRNDGLHPLRPTLTVSRAIPSSPVAPSRPWWASRGTGIAAAAAVVIAAGLGLWRVNGAGDSAGSGVATGAAARVYETRIGVRDSVLLADGSRVVLAPGSKLTVASDFATSRTVDLDGTAFFDVRHDAAHPFTVRSNGAEVRDIGTSFSVTSRAAGQVVISVTEGVVAVRPIRGDASPVELRAGDRGMLAAGSDDVPAMSVERGIVTPADVAWTRGELTYRDASIADVQADLRRWYGIELQVADSALASRTLTASLRGDDMTQALQIISTALGADVTQKGDTVVLRSAQRGKP